MCETERERESTNMTLNLFGEKKKRKSNWRLVFINKCPLTNINLLLFFFASVSYRKEMYVNVEATVNKIKS